jgi:hypothetical protein
VAKWTARWGYKAPPPTLVVSYKNQSVAELTKQDGRFLFRYLEPFFTQDLAPLPGLAPRREFVAFRELPAFFRERLPDTRRPEIKKYIRDNRIDESDELHMLACLGAHSITDSYELSLENAA